MILIDNFKEILSVILQVQENTAESLDFFFSAFVSDFDILKIYTKNIREINSNFVNIKMKEFPFSFLKFLVLSNIKVALTDEMIWSFFKLSPSMTFELIQNYPEKSTIEIWKKIILRIQSCRQLTDIHLSAYYFLLLSSLKCPSLISLFSSLKIGVFINEFLNGEKNLSDKKMLLFLLYLFFCRVSECVSNEFVSMHDYKDLLSRILSMKCNFKALVDFLVWILNPKSDSPIEFLYCPDSQKILALLPSPSFSFSTKILPFLLSSLVKSGFTEHAYEPSFAKLIETMNMIFKLGKTEDNLLIGLADQSVLDVLVPYAMKSDKYFFLLTSALSVSCVFYAFSEVYNSIYCDDQKLLNFLISVSSTSPLVNDFLRIDKKHEVNMQVMNGTIAMWVRFLGKTAQIAKIKTSSNIKVYVKMVENTFVLQVGNGLSKFVPMNDDISGWYFVIIEIKPKVITMSVNLATIKIEHLFGLNASISIGKWSSCFDLQSFRFFKSELNQISTYRLFALGPNYKANCVDNFMSINSNESLFVVKNSFISSLYLRWISSFHMKNLSLMPPFADAKKGESLFFKNYEFGISPPYCQFHTSNGNINSSILQNCFHFESFFNSLDAHGGIPLLIHFMAEIILKKRELHSLAFKLFDILVNRFPFIHYYFERNKIYQLIGQLLEKSPPDPKTVFHCSFSSEDNKYIITNISVFKYWFLNPSLYCEDFPDLVATLLASLESEFTEENLQMLELAGCFKCIVKIISNSKSRSEKFLSLLMDLALKITNKDNAQKHAEMIVKHLLVYHFKNSQNEGDHQPKIGQCDKPRIASAKSAPSIHKNISNSKSAESLNKGNSDEIDINKNSNKSDLSIASDDYNTDESISKDSDEKKTVSLIHLLGQILLNYGKKINISLNLLLPMFLNSPTSVKNSLYDIMMKYLSPNDHWSFIITLCRSQEDSKFAHYVYNNATSFILKSNKSSYEQFFFVTIPLIYLLEQDQKEKQIIFILASISTNIEEFEEFPSFIFDHVFRFLCKISSKKLMSKYIGTAFVITPFVNFLLQLFIYALFNPNSTEFVKSFIRGFFVLDNGEYSIRIIAHLFERIYSFNYLSSQINLQLISPFVCDLFTNVTFILRERIVNPPPFIQFFIQNACNFLDFFNTTEIVNCFLFLLNEISITSSAIALSIASTVLQCKTIYSLPNFNDIISMLESPMMISSKQKKVSLKFDPSKYSNFIQNVEEREKKMFLTVYCNSVLNQKLNSESILSEKEDNDEILIKWREIFTKLNFPGSQIYSGCPIKYKVDDSTIKYQLRRVLIPMNPSLDNQYLQFWETKYLSEKPHVRLLLKEVFQHINYSHTKEILFTSEVSLLHGTSIIPGYFIVTKNAIKFYNDEDLLVFNIKSIHSIRLIDYQHQPIGIFIDKKGMNSNFVMNSTMFAFKSKSLRVDFISNIEKNIDNINIIKSIDYNQINSISHSWSVGKISNMEYLLFLNFISGRTWSDLTRYPIFPWICVDFSKDRPVFRDFKYPLFAQTEEQKSNCLKYYQMTREIKGEAPHYYSNYISNVGSALYYLVRLEPFTTEEIEYQGGSLDSPDRTFQSFAISADVMTHPGERSTLELVPEVYFMPDVLVNLNGVAFPRSLINKNEISDVKLPVWDNKKCTPYKFVRKMRKLLESDEVSAGLNEWIDLIWGVRRSGVNASERFNIFSSIIYEFDQVKYYNDQKLLNAFSSLMHSCGQAPLQLFYDFHLKRQVHQCATSIFTKKQKLFLSNKNETKKPNIEDLLKFGFDVNINRKRDKSNEYNDCFYLTDKRIIIPCLKDGFVVVRITPNSSSSIDVERIDSSGKSGKSLLYFAEEISPKLICATKQSVFGKASSNDNIYSLNLNSFSFNSNDTKNFAYVDFITAHKIPIVVHWRLMTEKCKIMHVSTMRGHLQEITAVALNTPGSTCFAGHLDGKISMFRLDPDYFIRVFECRRKMPVSKIFVMADNSSILVIQNKGMNSELSADSPQSSSFVSLFEINGELLAEMEIPDEDIRDCVLTSFGNGVQNDLAFLLTESSRILVISMNSLKKKAVIEGGTAVIVALVLWNNAVLVALTNCNSLISWNLFDLSQNIKK